MDIATKGIIQLGSEQQRRWANQVVVCIWQKQVFSWHDSYNPCVLISLRQMPNNQGCTANEIPMWFFNGCRITLYAPNFKEVDGAYWFRVVCVCVRLSVHTSVRMSVQEPCMLGFWNFIYGFFMEKYLTHFLAHLSRRLTRWAYSIAMVRRPSIVVCRCPSSVVVVVHTFKPVYLWSQQANLDKILCVASLEWGKGCIRFWGRLDQNWFPWQQKAPIDL